MTTTSRRPHRYKPRWEYTGILTEISPPSPKAYPNKTTTPWCVAQAVPLNAPLAVSFLSDASMATSHSQTTVTSSQDPQTPASPPSPIHVARSHPPPMCVPTDTNALARMGRLAKKKVENLARRDALVDCWRKRRLSSITDRAVPCGVRRRHRVESACLECQVLDMKTHQDQYKIVARMNVAGSLRELMSVFATDDASHFHRSMAALFGAQYITGETLVQNECVDFHRATSARLPLALPLASRRTVSSRPSALSNIKLSLNSVTLQLRHGFMRRRQLVDWQFLDYLDEKVDAMTVTRVLQTVQPTKPSSRNHIGELLVGYVIREDPEAQFTRVYFYGEGKSTMARIECLLGSMVDTLCRLVVSVERQRLSALYRLHRGSENVPVAVSRCFSCNTGFGLTTQRHHCACCRQTVCRQCLARREIETRDDGTAATKALSIGPPVVQRVRVCRSCVDRVSLPSLVDTRDTIPRDPDDDIVVVDTLSEDE